MKIKVEILNEVYHLTETPNIIEKFFGVEKKRTTYRYHIGRFYDEDYNFVSVLDKRHRKLIDFNNKLKRYRTMNIIGTKDDFTVYFHPAAQTYVVFKNDILLKGNVYKFEDVKCYLE